MGAPCGPPCSQATWSARVCAPGPSHGLEPNRLSTDPVFKSIASQFMTQHFHVQLKLRLVKQLLLLKINIFGAVLPKVSFRVAGKCLFLYLSLSKFCCPYIVVFANKDTFNVVFVPSLAKVQVSHLSSRRKEKAGKEQYGAN